MAGGQYCCRISASKFWELTEKLPVMIEIIDNNIVLEDFYTLIETELKKMKKGCLVVLEPVTIKLHKSGKTDSLDLK
jgi:PII-like signaling protein